MYNLSLRSLEEPVNIDEEDNAEPQQAEHVSSWVSQQLCLCVTEGVPFIHLLIFCSTVLSTMGTWLKATGNPTKSKRIPFVPVMCVPVITVL